MGEKLNIYSTVVLPNNLPDSVEIKEFPKNKKIVLISPHSDDISVSCGGAVTVLSRFNKIVPIVLFSGYRGVEGKTKEEATKIREKEMLKESRVLKIEKPVFLRLVSYHDTSPSVIEKDIERVKKFFAEQKPEIIFLPKKDDLHPRHKLASNITLKALGFPCRLFFYENPWSAIGAFEFNAVFILSEKEIANKIKAIQQHQSQLERTRFDKAARSLAEFRGVVVPEQRIFGYGKDGSKLPDIFIESFKEVLRT